VLLVLDDYHPIGSQPVHASLAFCWSTGQPGWA
jgi:ATP/maltotriose-dependent transcriptional regulator MalT